MNLAKNGKTAFQNLFIVIQNLTDAERNLFANDLKKKNEDSRFSQLYKLTLDLIEKKKTSLTIDEQEIKDYCEKTFTNNFNKLVENLYKNLLLYISEQFKKDEWKEWQLKANQSLLEVETLCARELYSQAVAHLLKLESWLKNDKRFHEWFYDDFGIYARMANLKVNLAVKNFHQNFYTLNELDRILHNLLQLGYYFYSHNITEPNAYDFDLHKLIGYQLLTKYFQENHEINNSITAIDRVIPCVKSIYGDDKTATKLIVNYLKLKKIILLAQQGETDRIIGINLKDELSENKILSVMMMEELLRDIILIDSIRTPKAKRIKDSDYYIDFLLYSDAKIENTALRIEVNRSIIFFLSGKNLECIKSIHSLVKRDKTIMQKENALFLDLLFLELIAGLKKGDYDVGLLDDIRTLSDANSESNFERLAIDILFKWSKLPDYMKKLFPNEHVDELKKLENTMLKTKVIHHLILLTLQNKI
jgi:hypothetical protein